MKRKSLAPVTDLLVGSEPKSDYKRTKVTDLVQPLSDKTNLIQKDNFAGAANSAVKNQESSIERFLCSLMKHGKSSQTAIKNKDIESSSPICKNLSTTYRTMNETLDLGEKNQSLTELKHVRRLVKMNKIDDPNAEQDQGGFIQKISKKLELMVTSSSSKEDEKLRRSESKKSESLRKALQGKNPSINLQDGERVNEDAFFFSPSANTAITEVDSTEKGGDCISAEFFQILTAENEAEADTDTEADAEAEKENLDTRAVENKVRATPPPSIYVTAAKSAENRVLFPASNESKPESKPSSHLKVRSLSNTHSDASKNKRRQSFSINNSINSKSKAYYVYSSSLKNDTSASPAKRRLTTCQKPVTPTEQRRKSMNPRSAVAPEAASTSKPTAKSVTPEKNETFSLIKAENKQLKKDLLRKSKEVENLKREKLALLKKLQLVDPEEYTENKEKDLRLVEIPKVYCRIKPHGAKTTSKNALSFPEIAFMKNQKKEGTGDPFTLKCVELGNSDGRKAAFYFDRVFTEESTQADMFEEMNPFIQASIDGNNMCIVSYGESGSGKSYTIEGDMASESLAITGKSGILPRVAEAILSKLEIGETQSSFKQLELACVEISGDKTTDFINKGMDEEHPNSMHSAESDSRSMLQKITWYKVSQIQDLFEMLKEISAMKTITRNRENEDSHFVYLLKIISSNEKESYISFVEFAVKDGQKHQNLSKARQRDTIELMSNLKKLLNEIKEVLVIVNVNSGEEHSAHTKDALEFSSEFTDLMKTK